MYLFALIPPHVIVVLLTVIVSILAFRRRDWFQKLLLSPYRVAHNKEWYRLITHGFIHADYMHLAVNMIVLYSFGNEIVVGFFRVSYFPVLHFFVLYLAGIVVSSLSTAKKYRDEYAYSAVGASGGVSSVLFAYVLMQPQNKLWFMGIVPIPCLIFAPLYLWYCSYMGRKSNDNINHDAHFYGAVFGLAYPIIVEPLLLVNFANKTLEMLNKSFF